jgi:hypothetical protein
MKTWMLKAFLSLPILTGLVCCQQPETKGPTVYIVLKASLHEPGTARETFLLRMMGLGASEMRFVEEGATVAVRCNAPASAVAAIAADPDVAGVLPIEEGKQAAAISPVLPTEVPALPVVASNAPLISSPPFVSQPPTISPTIGVGGGGMNQGIAMLTDLAGGVIVKLLTPAPGCKIGFAAPSKAIPPLGGTGAFEVKASGNCAWQAVSTADWLHVTGGVLGPGAATLSFTVVAHAAGKRQAAVILQAVGATGPLRGKTVMMVTQE